MSADGPSPGKARLLRDLPATMQRLTGRRYAIDLDALDEPSLRALATFLRDVESEKTAAVRRATMEPWRRR